MKKFTLCLTLLMLLLCAGCGLAPTSGAPITSTPAQAVETPSNGTLDPAVYAPYTPYGLTADPQAGKLYYDGKLVRRFEDKVPAGGSRVKAVGFYEASGEIDLQALREGPDYKLVGLEVVKNAGGSGDDYAAFGLTLKNGAYFYQGQRVRLFWDSRSREASPAESGKPGLNKFSNWDAGGEIDLYAVRDFSRKDPDGYGILTGFRVASQEEFDANTELFAQRSGAVESAL